MFCQYKDIFGKVKEGVHSYRIFDIAIIDVLFTILAAFLIAKYFNNFNNFLIILIFLFILGIIFHRLFCVKTIVDNLLFN